MATRGIRAKSSRSDHSKGSDKFLARLMGEFGIVDRAAVANTPTEAFYDNSYVDKIKQSGFFRAVEVV